RYDLAQRASRVRPCRALLAAWRARALVRAARAGAALVLLATASLRAQSDSAPPDSTRAAPLAPAPPGPPPPPPPAAGPAAAPFPPGERPVSPTRPAPLAPAPPGPPPPPPPAAGPAAVPFPVGERLVYQARYGPFNVGTATLEVAGIDTLRGIETVHFVFRIEGGALWYHLNQRLESWVGRADFESRRYWNQTEEKGRSWERKFDIYPDSGFYREAGPDSAAATVPAPLDDAAFLYWIRTVPLEPGQRY